MKIETDARSFSGLAVQRHHLLYLFLLAIAVFLLIPRLVGIPHALQILASAHPLFVTIALLADVLRYFASAGSTRVLGGLFDTVIPFEPLVEAFFAGSAMNRTFSTGGAPGMLVRYLFLTKERITSGQVAVIYLIEDIAGLAIGALIFVVGTVTLALAPSTTAGIIALAFGFPVGSLFLCLAAFYAYNRRDLVSRSVHAFARMCDRFAVLFFGRHVYEPAAVEHGIDQFYLGMAVARKAPARVFLAFAFNLIRYAAGIGAVYFCFFALGAQVSIGALILIYTSASVLSTISAVPGELAILGSGWAILTMSFGVPKETAALALIISRTIAFWMPLPVGYLALWNLRRSGRV